MKHSILTLALTAIAVNLQAANDNPIRRNQVGYAPTQEKVIVIDGVNPTGKLRITTPDGKVLKPKVSRKAVSPWSGKTRYIVDFSAQQQEGQYQVTLGKVATCTLTVKERPLHDIAAASLRLFYLIRSGIPITMGGEYNRPLGHADTHVLVHNAACLLPTNNISTILLPSTRTFPRAAMPPPICLTK